MLTVKEGYAVDPVATKFWKDKNNEKMHKWINNANFSEDVRNLVIRAIQLFTQDKVDFAESITRVIRWSDSNGTYYTTGWASYAVYLYLRRKTDKSIGSAAKNKYQRAFEDFLPIAEKHKMKIDYK